SPIPSFSSPPSSSLLSASRAIPLLSHLLSSLIASEERSTRNRKINRISHSSLPLFSTYSLSPSSIKPRQIRTPNRIILSSLDRNLPLLCSPRRREKERSVQVEMPSPDSLLQLRSLKYLDLETGEAGLVSGAAAT
ncbi:unnamed protein product, partial [Linum tenue]